MLRMACIVEGHGEVEAVPILVRRIAAQIDPGMALRIFPALRIPRSRLLKTNGLESAVELAARRVGHTGIVLVLIDSDDDCPAELGPRLKERAVRQRQGLRLGVVLAKREFESWFLTSAASLQGLRSLPDELSPPEKPEEIRGAKEWLTRQMKGSRRYVETMDQPALAARFDLDEARRADSFDKFYREIVTLLTPHRPGTPKGSA